MESKGKKLGLDLEELMVSFVLSKAESISFTLASYK